MGRCVSGTTKKRPGSAPMESGLTRPTPWAQLTVLNKYTNIKLQIDIAFFEPAEFIAQGDKVVVLGSSKATVKSTSRSYETDWVHVFTVKDGKVTNFAEFFDTAAATKAFQKATAA